VAVQLAPVVEALEAAGPWPDEPGRVLWDDGLLERALRRMQPVTLQEIAHLALLRRVDTKYVVPRRDLPVLLAASRSDYAVLSVKGLRLQRYETLYFDTPQRELYRWHHNRVARRYKVRSRRYLESDLAFLEVKLKDHGTTAKVRTQTPDLLTHLNPKALAFIHDAVGCTPLALEDLQPTLWNEFSRITLVSERYEERVTLDLNLEMSWGPRAIRLADWVVAEIKSQAPRRDTPIVQQLRALGIRPSPFSKYCIGVASLWPEIKHNRFNRVLRHIQPNKEDSRVD